MDIIQEFEEKRKKRHVEEAEDFAAKFLEATGIKDFKFFCDNYVKGDRDGPPMHQLLYTLPSLNGMLDRNLSLDYFPNENPRGISANIVYRNKIKSEIPDILEFMSNSKLLRAIIPVIQQHLGKIGGYFIPQEVYYNNPNYEIKKFKIFDHKPHTPKGEKDYHYLVAVSMSVIPGYWEIPAQAIGGIEEEIRQIEKKEGTGDEKLEILSLKII